MIPDFDALLYEALDDGLGVAAVVTPLGTYPPSTLTVRDQTGLLTKGDTVEVLTTAPMVSVRMTTLAAASIPVEALQSGTLAYNGTTWRIEDVQEQPAPHAGSAGEVLLFLERVFVAPPAVFDGFTNLDFSQANNSGYLPVIGA